MSTTATAYDWTKSRILGGILPGGQFVTEGEVADAVRVSRTPVREAFLRLETEGLLKLYPKRGALVVPVTATEVRDVLDARFLVEPWAIERVAATTRRSSVVDALAESVEHQRTALGVGDETTFHLHDRAFHETLVAAAGNALVTGFYASLRDRQLRMSAAALGYDDRRAGQIIDEHEQIVAAIRSGDHTHGTTALRAHIATTRKLLQAIPDEP